MAVIVDSGGTPVLDPSVPAAIGRQSPRVRIVQALPMQAVEILKPRVVAPLTGDTSAVIASPRVYVHRMVGATRD